MEILKYVNRANLSVIFGLCLALNPFSLVNAYEVQVGTSPTTTYRYLKDQDIPSKGGNSRDLQVRGGSKYGGKLIGNGPNLSQTMGGGITIEGLKGDTKVTATAKYSKKGVARGLSRGLKFGKLGGPYGLVITTGLGLAIDKLLEEDGQEVPDRYGFDDDGRLIAFYDSKKKYLDYVEGSSMPFFTLDLFSEVKAGSPSMTCSVLSELRDCSRSIYTSDGGEFGGCLFTCGRGSGLSKVRIGRDITNSSCPSGSSWDGFGCAVSFGSEVVVDDSIIALTDSIDPDILFDKWGLEDYENIYPYIDEDPIVVFDVPDSIVHDTEISTFQDSAGNQYVVENIAQTDFSVDSSGGLFAQTSEIQNTYVDGDLIDTQVNVSNSNVSGSGSSPAPAPVPEIPTDCDLFPSQCRHNEWVETPMDTPPPNSSGDFSDLGVNVTLDDVQGVDVNFGEASCPAPIVVDLIIFEPVEITFYFMCEHAKSAKPFILISASLFALYIILGSNRGKA